MQVAQGGPSLGPTQEGKVSDDPATSDGWIAATMPIQDVLRIEAKHGTVLQFAQTLEQLLKTSILDQTKLPGKYDFVLELRKDEDPSDYTAVVGGVKKLGLRLEKYEGPVEFLVIDHLDKLTPN